MSFATTAIIKLTPELVAENERFHYHPTRFHFISDHKSFRPGKMHIVLGTTGVGKSSLTRALLADIAKQSKVLIYSTEETKLEFETQLAYSKSHLDLDNIRHMHEDEVLARPGMNPDNIAGLIQALDWAIAESRAKAVIIDNITASLFFQNINKAAELSQQLRSLMKKTGATFVVVAHTVPTIKEGQMFEAIDMRGSKMLAIRAEYVYCIARFTQTVEGHTRNATFVKVDKSRGHTNGKEIYRLWFDASIREYTSDEKFSYASFIEFTKSKGKK